MDSVDLSCKILNLEELNISSNGAEVKTVERELIRALVSSGIIREVNSGNQFDRVMLSSTS